MHERKKKQRKTDLSMTWKKSSNSKPNHIGWTRNKPKHYKTFGYLNYEHYEGNYDILGDEWQSTMYQQLNRVKWLREKLLGLSTLIEKHRKMETNEISIKKKATE